MTESGLAEVVRRVAEAVEEADGAAPVDEATSLALRHRPDTFAGTAHADGFALLHEGELSLAVVPEARRRGLGRRMAQEVLEGAGGRVTAWSHADHPAAATLASDLGFERTRVLWVMRLSSDAAIDPTDVSLRSFRPGDEDELLRVNAAAFAHHPEQGALDHAGLEERMDEPWWNPEDLLVAEEDGRILGFHWTKLHPAPPGATPHGEVYVLGVDPAAQGRGLGKTLTLAGLAHLRKRGAGEILLYVEADNDPAVALYRRVGFVHDGRDTHVQYTRA